ncbi:MAG TPA: GNAT family N-acetyltransferase [Tepidisphaeraceae bacterium]|jgi:predicted acetyltransferase|nr:GNAT family N-acetyltransferase [Tepidisphaeraceae bacterium]
MALAMRWVGESDFDRVAQTRQQCYGGADNESPKFQDSVRADLRAQPGDYLLAESAGQAVGTATSLSMSMWIRGGRVPCQGVAWVGTIKTHRRGSRAPGGGIASQIMNETIRLGRERGQVVSALMPFRGSFYEHFGYGIVERLCTWTVPLAVLPGGSFDDVRFYRPADREALGDCRRRIVEAGQCDIERSTGGWDYWLHKWREGFIVVDRSVDGTIHGYLAFGHIQKEKQDYVNVTEAGYQDVAALLRLLHFLCSLRDQYTYATLTLPADFSLNRILREHQIPHRLVNHPHAEARPYTRMQLRVLDHKRLIEAMRFPTAYGGRVVVAVHETEGNESRFAIEIEAGRASVQATDASAEIECSDKIWAGLVCGDLKTSDAARLGLVTVNTTGDVNGLDIFAAGKPPFCQEYF